VYKHSTGKILSPYNSLEGCKAITEDQGYLARPDAHQGVVIYVFIFMDGMMTGRGEQKFLNTCIAMKSWWPVHKLRHDLHFANDI
jgi:hypothetical protein